MKKNYNRKIIITTLVTIAPMLIGFALWSKMSDSLPVHFGFNGEPDRWMSKPVVVVAFPLVLAAIHVFSLLVTLNDPKKINIGKKMLDLIFWTIPFISWTCCVAIFGYAIGVKIDMARIVLFVIGILFINLGNYMTKNHQNYTVGIRLPWTLHSRENWNRTHRLASKLWIIGGAGCILDGYLHTGWLMIAIMTVLVVVPVGYSFVLYKKGV